MAERRHANRLQRKVLLVIALIILGPMLITGILSASWIANRFDTSIEGWLRESALVDETAIEDLHRNARLFADVLFEATDNRPHLAAEASPVPTRLRPLARELGISLVQLYGPNNALLYSSQPATLATYWAHGQDTAVVKVEQANKNLLAAITVVRIPRTPGGHYRLVLGTLFDKDLLNRLSRQSGLKTRLYYPRNGEFSRAFSQSGQATKLRLPKAALQGLNRHQSYYSAKAENGRYWGLYSPIVDANGRLEAILFSGQSRSGGAQLLTDQTTLTLAIILLGTVLSIATGYFISRLVVRPVEYLHEGVMKVTAQDFRAAIPIHSRDELGELARAFNGMADSLRESRDQQRREFQRDKMTALGELSLALAHEIRNPIGVIHTAAKLLENSQDDHKRAELRRVIREESLRLDQFLKDFQQLARHRQPSLVAIDPTHPLEKALQTQLAGRDNIHVSRHYQHADVRVQGDSDLLQQAWVNLVRNALEAMGPDGGQLEAGSQIEGDTVIVYLHDSGPGIPVEKMSRLFEPFFSTKDHGSGLGLTLANTLVEACGAELELIPGNWEGARFAMRLPLLKSEET